MGNSATHFVTCVAEIQPDTAEGLGEQEDDMPQVIELSEASHSFIIRVWLDDTDPAIWRGQITHVGSGNRQYFDNLSRIPEIITATLEPVSHEQSLRSLLRRLMQYWWHTLNY